jgi:hypothetical protein
MRVVEVIIDGFKSYAVRTVISGWDESFNSITGLNGSGKSNSECSPCHDSNIAELLDSSSRLNMFCSRYHEYEYCPRPKSTGMRKFSALVP